MTSGNTTSEYKLTIAVIVFAVVIAVASTLFDVIITPDSVQSYLTGVNDSAKEWISVLSPWVAGVVAWYMTVRTYLKSQKEKAKGEVEAAKAVANKMNE